MPWTYLGTFLSFHETNDNDTASYTPNYTTIITIITTQTAQLRLPLLVLLLPLGIIVNNHARHGLQIERIPPSVAYEYHQGTELSRHTQTHHLLLIVRITTVEGTDTRAEAVRRG